MSYGLRLAGFAFAVLLAGCGTQPVRPPADRAAAPPGAAAPAPPARGGGYYKDDGPGEHPPADLDAIADARPVAEPLHRYANSPYVVFGRKYVPRRSPGAYRSRGVASWYGRRFHGQPTSSGEPYDMYAMTGAHPTLPIPSYARVTNLDTGRSVIVRINDRGPFHAGRLIDLSYAAAWRLGYARQGSARVEVESLVPEDAPAPPAMAGAGADPIAELVRRLEAEAAPGVVPESPRGVFLQLGAFASRDNAEGFRARLAGELAGYGERLVVDAGDGIFRLRIGPYADAGDALRAAGRIAEAFGVRPFAVRR
ncbi:MAG: septal ring lytic transglycosylase RlpA family protein [Rhodocyclaceae bacterium]